MKYIKTYETAHSEEMRKLRNQFIGKYSIIKGLPGMEWQYVKNKFFMIYIVPRTWSGPIDNEYTAILVAGYKEILSILVTEDEIKLGEKIESGYIITISLKELSKIALYTSKKYDDCIEKLPFINSIEKYNL